MIAHLTTMDNSIVSNSQSGSWLLTPGSPLQDMCPLWSYKEADAALAGVAQ